MSRDCEQHRTGQSWDGDWLPRGEREQRWPARAQGASGGTEAGGGWRGGGPIPAPHTRPGPHQEESLCPMVQQPGDGDQRGTILGWSWAEGRGCEITEIMGDPG